MEIEDSCGRSDKDSSMSKNPNALDTTLNPAFNKKFDTKIKITLCGI